jgi:hypothetical protein
MYGGMGNHGQRFITRNPSDLWRLVTGSQIARDVITQKRENHNMPRQVGMDGRQLADVDCDSGFFFRFADSSFQRCFTQFNLSAGQFPTAFMRPHQQDFIVSVCDQRAGGDDVTGRGVDDGLVP